MSKISTVRALEILDSRGKPTVRTIVTLDSGRQYTASVPSGASTGKHEAVEMRDGDERRHLGQGVLKAVSNVNDVIAPHLVGQDPKNQKAIDDMMIQLDATENKGNLGANAILSISMAIARAAADSQNLPLWRYINELAFSDKPPQFPRIMVNVVNGGKHASWNFDIQEFMIIPKPNTPLESTRIACEIFQTLGKNLKKAGLSTLVGDEGGYSPALSSNEEVLGEIIKAGEGAGYKNGMDFSLALDCAANEFYEEGTYVLKKSGKKFTSSELGAYYLGIQNTYGIESIEDPFSEDDWGAFTEFTQRASHTGFTVIGDDLFVTNPKRLQRGITENAGNAILIKLNQIGTLSETIQAIQMAKKAGFKVAISHRSGETEDAFIADLAYASAAEYIKTGSMSRSDRLAKYNRLLEIEAGF